MDIIELLKRIATPDIVDVKFRCNECCDTLVVEVGSTGRYKTCDACMKPDDDGHSQVSKITGRRVL